MKKLLLILALLVSPFLSHASPADAISIWEKAAYGTLPGVTHVKLQGVNPALAATFEPMWGESNTYIPQVAALSSPYCASNSASDTSAGTGARTISVTGVTTSFARFTETVTMNGTSSVTLATSNILFIDKITVLTAGSGLFNAGIIQCGTGANTAGDPAVTHQYLGVSSDAAIPAAGAGFGNVSQSFFYGVPSGYSLVCKNLTMSTYLATTVIGIQAVVDGYTNSTGIVKRYASFSGNNAGGNGVYSPSYTVIPEKTLVIGKMASTSASAGLLSMDCLQISNSSSQSIF